MPIFKHLPKIANKFLVLSLLILPSTSGFTYSRLMPPKVKLSPLNINPSKISVSGISSGAYMATQLQVAYSSVFSGSASVAGAVYACSKGNVDRALTTCMKNTVASDSSEYTSLAKMLANQKLIDSLHNLKNKKIYIYNGSRDSVVHPSHAFQIADFYMQFGTPAKNILLNTGVPSGHGFATLSNGYPCDVEMIPWIVNCKFDLSREILSHLNGLSRNRVKQIESNLFEFDQNEFQGSENFLYKTGWIYIPTSCQKGQRCSLHVALHGCKMNTSFIGDKFAFQAGYNEWAESNNIVVLYPQSNSVPGKNPFGCWDWFGYTGNSFITKNSYQMISILKMISSLIYQVPN